MGKAWTTCSWFMISTSMLLPLLLYSASQPQRVATLIMHKCLFHVLNANTFLSTARWRIDKPDVAPPTGRPRRSSQGISSDDRSGKSILRHRLIWAQNKVFRDASPSAIPPSARDGTKRRSVESNIFQSRHAVSKLLLIYCFPSDFRLSDLSVIGCPCASGKNLHRCRPKSPANGGARETAYTDSPTLPTATFRRHPRRIRD